MIVNRLIVTADDLGLSAVSTPAIIRSLRDGLVSHASLIVNMPASEEAFELVRRHQLQDRVGFHFNLTEGVPLTEAMRRDPTFCPDGEFIKRPFLKSLLPLSAQAMQVVATEARAQIALARSRGIPLSHFDSHNDVHLLPYIAGVAARVARESGIQRVRPARNCGARQGYIRFLMNRSYNLWLTRQGLRMVRYFGTFDDIASVVARKGRFGLFSVEVMTHPVLDPGGVVIDAPSSEPLADRVERLSPFISSPGRPLAF